MELEQELDESKVDLDLDLSEYLEANIEELDLLLEDEPVMKVVEKFQKDHKASLYPVANKYHFPVGIVHEQQLRRYIYSPYGIQILQNKTLKEYITSCPSVDIGEDLNEMIRIFTSFDEKQGLILTQKGLYRGFLHAKSLIKMMHVKNILVLESKNQEISNALEMLKNSQKKLVEAEKMASLGMLVAGIAHEVNTPVGICVTAASSLEEQIGSFKQLFADSKMKRSDLEGFLSTSEHYSRLILSNLERAANLIQSFKSVAVDQSSEHKREFNLKEYLQSVLYSLTPTVKKGDHKVVLECPSDIILNSYPGAISQVITNLVMNSAIHAYDEGVSGTLKIVVDIFSEEKNEFIRIRYSDDGKGMSDEVRKKAFEPFFTTKRGAGGSGLGLHIIYNIVTSKFGGNIECLSKLGEGTLFTILIPLKHESDSV